MAQSVLIARPHLLRMVSRMTRNHAGANASRNHVLESRARHGIVAQHSVHLTGGSLRVFKLFVRLGVVSDKIVLSCPAHQPVTLAVETVEKVPFQKMIFEKWDGNAEECLVFRVPCSISAIPWQFFSLLWEIFVKVFRTKGFSTVSLGRQRTDTLPVSEGE